MATNKEKSWVNFQPGLSNIYVDTAWCRDYRLAAKRGPKARMGPNEPFQWTIHVFLIRGLLQNFSCTVAAGNKEISKTADLDQSIVVCVSEGTESVYCKKAAAGWDRLATSLNECSSVGNKSSFKVFG